ncbi:MAG TPA: HemK/PrmC family methyltransferase [Candidatus Saccharimonadales bacterium]|nr:HemK/PrmC family methyltransferase [Candidatus Saccharimonadales bacterium]
MTISEYLAVTTAALQAAGVESARLDALILLEDALHEDRAVLLAHPEREIPAPVYAGLYKKRVRRETHEPLAYIRGQAPFFGRTFLVDKRVLVPRPESEAIIELLKQFVPQLPRPQDPQHGAEALSVADVGTGSGILGLTAGLELPGTQVFLYDIDDSALEVARHNSGALHVSATLEKQDLLSGIKRQHDIILANLPYVPEQLTINRAAGHEPKQALFSGPDGLDHYKRFWAALAGDVNKPMLIITESLPAQHHTNALLARAAGFYMAGRQGFAQAFQPL